MTAVTDRASEDRQTASSGTKRGRLERLIAAVRLQRREWIPIAFVVANAIAFMITQPGVGDLWAARARETAARNGVGLTYWFGWFSGGSTPGNYSVITPYVSVVVGTELLGSLSAIACVIGCIYLVRDTRFPIAASVVASIGAATNLWAGRIPFLFGTAFVVATFLAVRSRRTAGASIFAILSALCSPVSGAFIALGLVGTFLTEATKEFRRICFITVVAVGMALGLVALGFGNPGPEGLSFWLFFEFLGCAAGMLLIRTPDFVRTNLWLSILVVIPLYLIPNGMGSNIMRLVWFYLPVAVVATSARKLWVTILLILPIGVAGIESTAAELYVASGASSFTSYYQPLATKLDQLAVNSCRVEVVWTGAHTGYATLLGHAMLARGWETQEDQALNGVLSNTPVLSPIAYKAWLDNNAVCYVALPSDRSKGSPEWKLVNGNTPNYLSPVWQTSGWTLYQVSDSTPIIAPPATMVAATQARLTITVPCACKIPLRVRYSKFLEAANAAKGAPDGVVASDSDGWAYITTTTAGTYHLDGRISGLFH